MGTFAFFLGWVQCTTPYEGVSADAADAGADAPGSGSSSSGDAEQKPERDAGPTALEPQRMLAVGEQTSCLLRPDGKVVCWGASEHGQLGYVGDYANVKLPFVLADLDHVARIAAGADFFCAVGTDRTVKCWGDNRYGQVAQDYVASKNVTKPTLVPGLTDVVEITAGPDHACARRLDRSVACWGSNAVSQLGHVQSEDADCGNSTRCNFTPQTIATLTADALASGAGHTCARDGSKVACWGGNYSSQLGHSGGTLQDTEPLGGGHMNPNPSVASNRAAQVFAGAFDSCILAATGDAQCLGDNGYGQANGGTPEGPNAPKEYPSPTAIVGLPATGVTRVSSGSIHGCALANGTLYCWGRDDAYAIPGIASTVIVTTAFPFNDAAGAPVSLVELAIGTSGYSQTRCAISTKNDVYCWGANTYGQAAQPDPLGANRSVKQPTKVTLPE